MHNNPKVKHFLIGLLLTLPALGHAQVSNTNSPYSFSGLGQINYQGFAAQRAAGATGRATREDGTFSFTNPASYSALKLTDLEFSAGFSMVNQHSEIQDRSYSNGSFDYIALGFPVIEDRMGMAIGLIPYANSGYHLTYSEVEDGRDVDYFYQGTGAINRLYVGIGVEVLKGLSAGINAEYDFGNIRRITDKRYTNSSDIYSFQDIDDTKYRGFGLSGGVQYSVHSKGGIRATLGATVSLGRDLMAGNQQIFRTYNSLGNFIVDTLIDRKYPDVALEVPIGYGVALQTGKPGKWAFGVEYVSQAWSGFEDISGISGFNDMISYGAGGYYQFMSPVDKTATMPKLEGFLKTLRFYGGVRYEQGYLQFNGQAIEEIGISFGLGIPMLKNIKLTSGTVPMISMLNLTAEWVTRGTTGSELVQEEMIRLSIGLNFNDKWFIKRKFQ